MMKLLKQIQKKFKISASKITAIILFWPLAVISIEAEHWELALVFLLCSLLILLRVENKPDDFYGRLIKKFISRILHKCKISSGEIKVIIIFWPLFVISVLLGLLGLESGNPELFRKSKRNFKLQTAVPKMPVKV